MATVNPSSKNSILNRGTYGGALLSGLFVIVISAAGIRLGTYWQNPSLLALGALIGAIVGAILGNMAARGAWVIHLRSSSALPQFIWAAAVFGIVVLALLFSFSFLGPQDSPGIILSVVFSAAAGLWCWTSGVHLNRQAADARVGV